ncbi:MAG: hypothetical protein MJ059_01585 [Lachnospiraceae bacterium]|nr:hypothetical protein [Lachnospiraceae bacterium]
MKEISEHQIYNLLDDKYSRIGCDYVILSSDDEYRGIETHKKAVITAFEILNIRFSPYELSIDIEPEKMSAVRSSADELLSIPSDEYFEGRKKANRNYTVPSPIPYWYAFLEPPGGTPYMKSDFTEFNDVLFPNKDSIEVYRWNDDFSGYFDDGKEWWGTGLWSAYDAETGIFVIICASLTD